MVEGLWTAEFGSSSGAFGGGVAVFHGGKIMGGDAGYFYTGNYALHDSSFKATLIITPFIQNYSSVFQTMNQILTMDLVGSIVDENLLKAQGHARGLPHLNFGVKFVKRDTW